MSYPVNILFFFLNYKPGLKDFTKNFLQRCYAIVIIKFELKNKQMHVFEEPVGRFISEFLQTKILFY